MLNSACCKGLIGPYVMKTLTKKHAGGRLSGHQVSAIVIRAAACNLAIGQNGVPKLWDEVLEVAQEMEKTGTEQPTQKKAKRGPDPEGPAQYCRYVVLVIFINTTHLNIMSLLILLVALYECITSTPTILGII
jgi:hypothetical protein